MELPSNQTIARFFLLTYVSMVIATWWGLPIRVVGQATDVIFASPFFCSSLLAAALIFYASYRERKEKLVVFAIGLALEIGLAVLRMRKGLEFGELYGLFGMGLGTVALFHLLRKSIRKDAGDKLRNLAHEVALLPIFVLASGPMLRLALMMLPRVYDHYFIYLDATFYPYFGQPSVALLSGSPLLYRLCIWVYESLPLALGVAHILAKPEHPTGERSALLLLFVMLGGAGWIVYALVPVIGPGPFVDTFGATSFDNPSLALTGIVDTYKAARNCVPSLHTAWALAAFLAVPTRLRAAKVGFGIFLFLTLLATLGLKAHYFVDLVLGVPFAIGLRALVESAQPGLSSEQLRTRRQTAATSAVLFIITLSLYVTYPSQLAAIPPANWLQAGACVAIPLLMHRRAKLANSTAPAIEADYVATTATLPAFSRTVTALFVASGLSALIIEVVISRSMALTFGSTSTAQSTVLATYMGGMALGAWWGGKRASAAKTPIRMYAHCELAIAGYTLCAPYLMGLAQQLYVALMQGQNYPAAVTTGVQFLLGALILSPPTILMGATMPALLAHFSRGGENIAPAVARLYAANTAGAAIGALSAAYFFLPNFGVQGTVAFACAFSLFAALGALRRAKNIDGAIEATAQASTPAASHDAIAPEPLPQAATVLTQRRIALAVLSIGGVVTLALEGIYVHLLAVVVGCSSYAFGLMLACFLAALGMGSIAARKLFASQRSPESMLAWAQLAIFAATTGGLFIWNEIPGYFASFASSPFMHSFAAREWVRFFVCVVAMAPPAFFIGMSYPCAMTLFVESHPENRVAAMGRASAINTVGNVLGALLGGFALIPMLGSYHAILLLGFLSGSLALAATLSLAKTARISLIATAMTVCAIALTMPSDFDYTRLASGANVYFAQQGYGKVIDHVESIDGGLTTVNLSHDANGEVHTLLTNGKFQGDDSLQREAKAQYGFGLVPLLHADGHEQALVIGVGTGCSARVVVNSGFAQVHLVDLSADILTMADKYFSKINDDVLRNPRATKHVADGRNFLLTTDKKFDLITMELTSIWFAGAANLYNQEFYTLAKSRMHERGVLQQWIQLHRVTPLEIASVLASMRTEFSHLWLYFVQSQGIIVACNHDCQPTPERLAKLNANPGLQTELSAFPNGAREVRDQLLMGPAGVDAFLEDVTQLVGERENLLSTDDNLRLEYATPRGNVMPYLASLKANLQSLSRYR